MRQDIAVAIETTRAHGFGFNHSLCHGDFGNLDLLSKRASGWTGLIYSPKSMISLPGLWQTYVNTVGAAVIHSASNLLG